MPDFEVPRPLQRPMQRPPGLQQGGQAPGLGARPPGRGNQARVEGTGLGRSAPGQGTGTGTQQDAGLDAMVQSTVAMATDATRQGVMDRTLREFDTITVTVPVSTKKGLSLTATVTIQTPYRINYTATDYAVGHKSYPSSKLPSADAEGAPAGLADSTSRSKLGKGSPTDIRLVLQAAIDQGKVKVPKLDDKLLGADGALTAEGNLQVEAAIKGYLTAGSGRLIGVDCSGFVYQIVTRMIATKDDPNPEWMHGVLDTGTGNLKGESALTTIQAASTLRTGDLLLHGRHVEMVRSSTQLSAADAGKLQGVTVPEGAQAYKLEVMESSPEGGRQGPTSSEWVVVQSATALTWYKKGATTWSQKSVVARRPNVLGQVPATDQENAPKPPQKGRKRRG